MASLYACLYVCISIGIAVAVGRYCVPTLRKPLMQCATGWIAVTVLVFFSPISSIFMLLSSIAMIALSPKEPSGRLMFYCALSIAIPPGIDWVISAGSIKIIVLTFPEILTLCVLLPLALRKANLSDNESHTALVSHQPAAKTIKKVAIAAMGFAVCIILLDFRNTSFTNGMRLALVHAFTVGILIAALARTAGRSDVFQYVVWGVFFGGLFNLFIGLVQDLTQWLLYSEVSNSLRSTVLRYDLMMSQRESGLRIPGTLTPIPYGIHMVICSAICAVFYFQGVSRKSILILSFLFLYAAYRSGSRGAVLCLAAALFVWIVWAPSARKIRAWILIGAAVLVIAIFATPLGGKLVAVDEYGTFSYRIDLVLNSMDSISRHPLFGTPDFLSNASLQRSRQGEGIIDIVNSYLGVVLRYGFAGLALFVLPLWWSVSALLQARRSSEIEGDIGNERIARCALSIVVGFAFAIATVSLIDHLPKLYWILIFVGLAVTVQRATDLAAAPVVASPRRTVGSPKRRTLPRQRPVSKHK